LNGDKKKHSEKTQVMLDIKNKSGDDYTGDIVVLDENKSEFIGSDGNNWEEATSERYKSVHSKDRLDSIYVKIFLNYDGTTRRYKDTIEPPQNAEKIIIIAKILEEPKIIFEDEYDN
jgi:hypothetical protein